MPVDGLGDLGLPTLDLAGADQPAGAWVDDDCGILITPPRDPGDAEDSHSLIELVELDDQGEMWAGSYRDCPDAYGRAGDVIAALTSRPADDPWVREVVAALDRDLEWARWWGPGTGRLRGSLEIVRGQGERVHATAVANRESIYRHGLDWNRMGRAPGLAGSTKPELPAIFVATDLGAVSYLLHMSHVPLDIWAIDVDGLWLENGPTGWDVISRPVSRDRLSLLVRDIPAGGFTRDASGGAGKRRPHHSNQARHRPHRR